MLINLTRPVVLLASSRPTGNTFALAKLMFADDSTPVVDLAALNIGYYSYSNAHADDDFLPLVEQLMMSPVGVLATPLYWYSMSAQAKTFLDRLSDLLSFRKALGCQLRGKGFAVVCAGSDPGLPPSFNQPFELSCSYLGMHFLGSCYAQFDGDQLVNADAATAATEFGATIHREAHRGTTRSQSSPDARIKFS